MGKLRLRDRRDLSGLIKITCLGFFISAECNLSWFLVKNTRVGLYQACEGLSSNCTYLPWYPDGIYDASYVTRILLIIAAISILGSAVCQIAAWVGGNDKLKIFLIFEGAFDLTAGGFIVVAMICFSVISASSPLASVSGWYFGWCYALTWTAGILYIFAGLVEIAAIKSDMQEDSFAKLTSYQENNELSQATTVGHYKAIAE